MQARYYDPVIGRFLSNDPVAFAPNRPDMFNRFAYAANDPVNKLDPDGNLPALAVPVVLATARAAAAGCARSPACVKAAAATGAYVAAKATGAFDAAVDGIGVLISNNDDAAGQGDDVGESPELKDMKKLSKGRIKELGKRGFDAEDTKKELGMGGQEDLYSDKDGNIFAGAKDGSGEATPTGENINDILDQDIEE